RASADRRDFPRRRLRRRQPAADPAERLEAAGSRSGGVTSSARASDYLLLTCEHAGNSIPRAYAPLFRGADALLATPRGWDPGAHVLARFLAKRLRRPLHAVTWSRLFVEANRAAHNPRIWSKFTRALPKAERAAILARYWWPHRSKVEAAVASAARDARV